MKLIICDCYCRGEYYCARRWNCDNFYYYFSVYCRLTCVDSFQTFEQLFAFVDLLATVGDTQ
jgi:hypothetical protein